MHKYLHKYRQSINQQLYDPGRFNNIDLIIWIKIHESSISALLDTKYQEISETATPILSGE